MVLSAAIRVFTLFALHFNRTKSITIPVVVFSCTNCFRKPDKCCIGTFISPTLILTTRACVGACSSINIRGNLVPIVEIYEHAHYEARTHNIGKEAEGFALARIANRTNYPRIKLSTLETKSAIGLKAIIPRIDDNAIKLKPVVITLCEESSTFSTGFYTCTAIDDGNKCKITQGSPLLVNGRLIGIMGDQDPAKCKFPETAFMAIAPVISWIQMVTNMSRCKKKQNLQASHVSHKILGTNNNSIIHVTSTQVMSSIKATIPPSETQKFFEELNKPNLRNVNENASFATVHKVLKHVERNKMSVNSVKTTLHLFTSTIGTKPVSPLISIISHVNLSKSTAKLSSSNILRQNFTKTTQKKSVIANKKVTLSVKLKPIKKKITKKNKSVKAMSASKKTSSLKVNSKSTGSDPTISTTTEKEIISNVKETVTNAMDWFNENIRNKLKENPPVLILTTARPATTEFVDLT